MPPFSSATTSSLSALTQLSPSVYLSKPLSQPAHPARSEEEQEVNLAAAEHVASVDTTSISSRRLSLPPKLIILVTWMSAHPSHISKYVLGYRTHYPASRILVVRSSPPDLLYRRTKAQRRRVAPAISVVLSSCSAICNDPEIILHVFSNGGSHQTLNLLRAYSETTLRSFPPHVTIFDSCPGRATFKRSVLALSSALPSFPPARLFFLLLIYLVVSVYWVVFIPFGIPDPVERIRRALSSRVVMPEETKRSYIYSETDPMVGWHDVEDHARDATGEGFVVQREKFDGSGHCAHIKVGGGTRYWMIVDALWQARRREQDI
ncbi:hypothetical protein MMC07_004175 [Pseudocyphellaria aurata]|nr:hypothetical protein [Pseudocyphellaria aurata]